MQPSIFSLAGAVSTILLACDPIDPAAVVNWGGSAAKVSYTACPCVEGSVYNLVQESIGVIV